MTQTRLVSPIPGARRRPTLRARALQAGLIGLLGSFALAGQSTPVNLKLPALDGQVEGRVVAFRVLESAVGQDLNADGDTSDQVLHVYDHQSQTLQNTGVATFTFELHGDYVSCAVGEFTQGNADLNGDGDAFDSVLHVFDHRRGTLTNLGIATQRLTPSDGDELFFLATEFGQGNTDLNGDGDARDTVAHVLDAKRLTTTNLGLASFNVQHSGRDAAILVGEFAQGGTDLNGDGDASDSVVHLYDLNNDAVTNTGLAGFVDGFGKKDVALRVFEVSQGVDLNGDGDTSDAVLHAIARRGGPARNFGVATAAVQIADRTVAFTAPERLQGADLNGDGDTADTVVHVVDLRDDSVTNLRLASFQITLSEAGLGFGVFESQQGNTDLNGDGDTADSVLHTLDLKKGTIRNSGLAMQIVGWAGDHLVFNVLERNQGGKDLNGDGDAVDNIVHLYDAKKAVISTELLAGNSFALGPRSFVFNVSESAQGGVDLNGDGDTGDFVIHVRDPGQPASVNTGIAGNAAFFRFPTKKVFAFTVSEARQGNIDLNDDGDTSDNILHVRDLPVK